jgi:hypothetical protein
MYMETGERWEVVDRAHQKGLARIMWSKMNIPEKL